MPECPCSHPPECHGGLDGDFGYVGEGDSLKKRRIPGLRDMSRTVRTKRGMHRTQGKTKVEEPKYVTVFGE